MTEVFLKQERAFIEIQLENDHLLRKNQLLTTELNELKAKMETLTESYSKLSKFESSYQLVMEKFPNQSLEKLLDKLEYLEKAGMDFTRKIGELEDEKIIIDREKQALTQKYEEKYIEMNKRESEAERKMQLAKDRLGEKSELMQEANKYKENYFLLFKNIIALFTEWNDEIRIYFNPDPKQKAVEPQAALEDPIEILNLLKKMVRISTPEGLQKYLRKIIVSANQLQRDFFPGATNEKFDPDKIYERMYKKMKNLQKENEKLKQAGFEKASASARKRESLLFGKNRLKSASDVKSKPQASEDKIENFNEEMFWNW